MAATDMPDSKRELIYILIRKMQDAVNALVRSTEAQNLSMEQLQKKCNDLEEVKKYREAVNYDAHSKYQVVATLGNAIKSWIEFRSFEGVRT